MRRKANIHSSAQHAAVIPSFDPKRMGIQSTLPAVPSLALGSAEVSPIEMTRAFGSVATNIQSLEPYSIRSICRQFPASACRGRKLAGTRGEVRLKGGLRGETKPICGPPPPLPLRNQRPTSHSGLEGYCVHNGMAWNRKAPEPTMALRQPAARPRKLEEPRISPQPFFIH